MIGRHPPRTSRLICCSGIAVALAASVAACGSSSTSGSSQGPIKVGVSLSLSGDFSADGKAFQQGYELWRDYINAHGGVLNRQVELVELNDNSDPQQVATNYQTLINVDHVDVLFGPFSTLLTKAADVVANRFGFAFVEGAGGGPSVFTQGLNNVFDVSLPVANNLVSFANYIAALPASQRPATAAYATEDDPFTQPQVDTARSLMEAAGIKTVYYKVYGSETTDFSPIADAMIAAHAQVVVTGTLLPDIASFIQHFRQQHYNPQALIATAGPDQGTQFLNAIGGSPVAEGVFVPNGWYPTLNAPENQTMVSAFLAKYGGNASDISSDVAEAWSVGQVIDQAVTKNNSLDQTKLMQTLHSATFDSVQGTVKFDSSGQNTSATAYLFQWQAGQLIPVFPTSAANGATPEFPKKTWP